MGASSALDRCHPCATATEDYDQRRQAVTRRPEFLTLPLRAWPLAVSIRRHFTASRVSEGSACGIRATTLEATTG